MPNKTTTQILKEFREKFLMKDSECTWNSYPLPEEIEDWLTQVFAQQQQEDYQWKKRFMELKNYLLFQEKMVEQNHAGGFAGDELILLETINEHVEEIEESEY